MTSRRVNHANAMSHKTNLEKLMEEHKKTQCLLRDVLEKQVISNDLNLELIKLIAPLFPPSMNIYGASTKIEEAPATGNRVIPSSLTGPGVKKITASLMMLLEYLLDHYPPSGPEKTLMLMLIFLLDPQLVKLILRSNLCLGRVWKTSSLHYIVSS
ncbi:hypothetical protein BD408DRAFT_427176 [Parasitella parasitica]|nr:hypothetical protein BD408DRAFT_427176 [Parasitella parasitica]